MEVPKLSKIVVNICVGTKHDREALTEAAEELAVITGQNLATASGLIGKKVTALSDDGQSVQGIVDRVSVAEDRNDGEQRPLKVHVGTHSIDIENIQEIADRGG